MERRNFPRVKVTRPVLYLPDMYPSPKAASTLDLSMGGTRIETPHLLVEGERLEISIVIRSKVIKCRGHVVYTELPPGAGRKAGIQFEEISEEDSLYLGEYISFVMDQKDPMSPL